MSARGTIVIAAWLLASVASAQLAGGLSDPRGRVAPSTAPPPTQESSDAPVNPAPGSPATENPATENPATENPATENEAASPRGTAPPRDIPVSSDGLGRRLASPAAAPAPVAPADSEPPWPGPQVQIGYSFYRIADGYGGGDVHAGNVMIYVQLPVRELRLGLLGEFGSHDYSLGGDDLIVRGGLEIGAQLHGLLEPFVPHAVAIVSVGAVVGDRFDTTIAHAFAGAGLGLGGELRVVRNLNVGFQVSYQRLEMDGAGFDVFMLRLFVGF